MHAWSRDLGVWRGNIEIFLNDWKKNYEKVNESLRKNGGNYCRMQ